MTSARSLPQGRYPTERSPRSRRRWFVVLTTLVVAAGVLLAWLGYQRFSDPDISGEASGYLIIDSSTVEVKFTVNRKDPSKPATCVLRARSKDGSETGRREVYIPASSQTQLSLSSLVRTSAAPAVGEVYGCSESVPDYLVAP
ncbi:MULTISPECIES: DUF4307 domain-containing protein [Williamsia]|uniref:DUF4307 domain-containing protein n=1 Tax=Williamsia TaxID=85043 RepID=UPI000A10FCDC|nr:MULTISPECIES: DUF4307 domain-containing protein [Williamsia]ORM37701.1 hypothetical protein BFL43_03285 [Williamsia sp. 1135]